MEHHLRIVISCVTFDTVKVVEPAKHFKADRIYLIHKAAKRPYSDFLDEVTDQLKKENIETISRYVDINDFQSVLRELTDILEEEKEHGNHVYVNIEAGSAIYSSASLLASMMEGAIPFNVGTKEHMVKNTDVYYENGKPVGMAKEVFDPFILPEFKIDRPNRKLVKGLKIWINNNEDGRRTRLTATINEMERSGLITDCFDDRGKLTHRGQMSFIRTYRDKWIKNGWMEKTDDNTFRATPFGEIISGSF